MKKRIIISVTNDLVTDQRINKVAFSLDRAGYEVLLIGRKLKNSPDSEPLKFESIRFSLPFNNGPLFYFVYNLYLFIYLLFSNFDILLSNDLDTLPANFLAARFRGKPLVYDSHELFTEIPELVDRPEIKKIWLSIESWILPQLKYSYTVCASIADIYNKKYGLDMKVVKNVPVCTKHHDIQSDIIDTKGKKIIIYQGALNIGRGIETVIRAMNFVDYAVFVVVGDGDIKKELVAITKKENLQDKVIFTGIILIDKLPSYTNQADLGISLEEDLGLNYYYALPNKLFDYIKASVPVLASDLPEIKEIVNGNNIGITINNKNPEYVAEKIRFMLNSEIDRKVWQDNLKQIKGKYCWEYEEKVLLNIFKNI